jgi:hypothetical protein
MLFLGHIKPEIDSKTGFFIKFENAYYISELFSEIGIFGATHLIFHGPHTTRIQREST